MNHLSRAILVLEDGSVFNGIPLGFPGITCGELVFNTAMTGYQEILTDPSYTQQIVNFTYPHIGNVGVNKDDAESSIGISVAGLITRELSDFTSSWRSEMSLADYLIANRTVGIAGIDTRYLTQKLRDQGALRACIMTKNCDIKIAINHLNSFETLEGKDLASLVSTPKTYHYVATAKDQNFPIYRVVVYDFGVKRSILKYQIGRAHV